MQRRTFLSGVAGAVSVGTAGCLGFGGGGTVESLPPPVAGNPDADVTVKVFEDYACPHCQHFVIDILPKIASNYIEPGTIRYEHHDFPIPVHPRWSWRVPSAARAVQDTVGDAAFFEYSHALFENQERYSLDLIAGLAGDVGADPATVRQAFKSQRYRPVIEADRKRGTRMGVRGTPTVFVNGQALPGYGYQRVANAIESEL